MIEILKAKREQLKEQKVIPSTFYEDLERLIDEYRAKLYAERDGQIAEQNLIIDAKIELLDDLIEEGEAKTEQKEVETDEEVREHSSVL